MSTKLHEQAMEKIRAGNAAGLADIVEKVHDWVNKFRADKCETTLHYISDAEEHNLDPDVAIPEITVRVRVPNAAPTDADDDFEPDED